MKYLLIASILILGSCSKEKSLRMEELKAVATLSVSGMKVILDMHGSKGVLSAYGWQSEAPSPGSVSYYPKSSYTKSPGYDLITEPIIATVSIKGIYRFRLTVYKESGESDYTTAEIEVK